jgi:hypothetical protein
MVETEANGSETLASVLVRRARQASDGRLVLDAASGLLVGALALAFRPPAWPVLLSAAVSLLAFGAWGISDRALRETEEGSGGAHALRALCVAMAIVGALGVVALAATTMAFMLGTWIS